VSDLAAAAATKLRPAYLTDPVLGVIDPEEMPSSFMALPDDEQRWRGRLYLVVLWGSHHKPYSWWAALDVNPEDEADLRRSMEEMPDEVFLGHWRAMLAEIAVETGKGLTVA
jgi:hypothetical protein